MQAELLLSTAIAYEYSQLQFLLKQKEILLAQDENRKAVLGVTERRNENALDTSIQQLQSKANTLNIQASLAEIDPQIEEQIHKLKMLSALGQDGAARVSSFPRERRRGSLSRIASPILLAPQSTGPTP